MREYTKSYPPACVGGLLTLPSPGGFARPPGRVTRRIGQAFGLLDQIPGHGECGKVDCCDIYVNI